MPKYPKPAKLNGWDFSKLRVTETGPRTNYVKIVLSHLNKQKTLLDIGTGGGEKLATHAPRVRYAVAIDNGRNMVETAKRNFHKNRLGNAHMILCDSAKLPLVQASFEVVTDRHAPFKAQEIARVLKNGGVFITQQVSEGDKQNIKRIFRRGQDYGKKPGTKKRRYIRELKHAGLRIIKACTINTTEYYKTMKDIIFLIANTPMIPDFNIEKEQSKLAEIEEKLKTKRGIKTNSERLLIVGTKAS